MRFRYASELVETVADPGPSAICVGCGLCCDGTLFPHAKVSPGEEARMAASGLELFEQDGRTVFREPCPHSAGGRCAIYEERFNICRSFRCKLLRMHEARKVTYAEATATIQTAQKLRHEAGEIDARAISNETRPETIRELVAALADASEGERIAVGARLLKLVAFDEFLSSRFIGNRRTDNPESSSAN